MIPFNPDQGLEARALEIVSESENRLTARACIRIFSREFGLTARQAKKMLKTLVDQQDLAYQDLYGSTYIMESFSKPVRVTDHFIITPPGVSAATRFGKDPAGGIAITITQGISFGSGHHPTTRLCLEALDFLFFNGSPPPGGQAGDIGTGSGILAIAACLAGAHRCTAWEIDANALSEARQNVTANGLENQVSIIDGFMTPDRLKRSLLTANLRFPTLKQLAPLIRDALLPGARLVLSGIRTWEKEQLATHYKAYGFTQTWEKDHKNWSALILTESGARDDSP